MARAAGADALARECFVNELRSWLGLGPLYDLTARPSRLQPERPTLAYGLTPLLFARSFARCRRA